MATKGLCLMLLTGQGIEIIWLTQLPRTLLRVWLVTSPIIFNLIELQSYKTGHNIETVLIRTKNGITMSVDQSKIEVLVPLKIPITCDTGVHTLRSQLETGN